MVAVGVPRSLMSSLVLQLCREFFDEKVDANRDATSRADPPTFAIVPADCDLSSFGTVTAADTITAPTS